MMGENTERKPITQLLTVNKNRTAAGPVFVDTLERIGQLSGVAGRYFFTTAINSSGSVGLVIYSVTPIRFA